MRLAEKLDWKGLIYFYKCPFYPVPTLPYVSPAARLYADRGHVLYVNLYPANVENRVSS
jgi:hypothetical protein